MKPHINLSVARFYLLFLLVGLVSPLSVLAQPIQPTSGTAVDKGQFYFLPLAVEVEAPSAWNLAPPAGATPDVSPPPTQVINSTLDGYCLGYPPSPHGAISEEYIVSVCQDHMFVRERSGNTVWRGWMDVLMIAALGVEHYMFNPKVVFDPHARRWIIVGMDFDVSSFIPMADNNAGFGMFVSTTDNPLDPWDVYVISEPGPIEVLSLFPNIGFTQQWLAVHVSNDDRYHANEADYFVRSDLFLFEKSALYTAKTGTYSYFSDVGTKAVVPVQALDPLENTLYLIEEWQPAAGTLRLSKVTEGAGGPELQMGAGFPVGTPWSAQSAAGYAEDFGPQPPIAPKVAMKSTGLQHAVLRDNSIWTTHMVFLPAAEATRGSVQWWQISRGGVALDHGVIEGVADEIAYGFPSIAVNGAGEVLIGHTRFWNMLGPNASYSFRTAQDPPGTMRQVRVFTNSITLYDIECCGFTNIWGFYSATVVDPVDDRTFWTHQQRVLDANYGNGRTLWAVVDPSVTIDAPDDDSGSSGGDAGGGGSVGGGSGGSGGSGDFSNFYNSPDVGGAASEASCTLTAQSPASNWWALPLVTAILIGMRRRFAR